MKMRTSARNLGCLLIVALSFLVGMPDLAQAKDSQPNDWGVLVMAHGGGAAWNQAVEQTVSPLRGKFPIEIAYGMAKTSTLRAASQRLESQGVKRIVVVRMFISGDSFLESTEYILGHRDELPSGGHGMRYAGYGNDKKEMKKGMKKDSGHGKAGMGASGMGESGGGHHMETPEPIELKARVVISKQGVGESPLVDEILVDRVKSLSKDPSKESVLILAHGPGDEAENERWLAHMRLRVQGLHGLGAFQHVHCETLREDWPERRKASEQRIRSYVENATRDGGRCIVIPFRVAGFGPYKDVLQGLKYVADGRGFCPHPNMTKWIQATAKESMGVAEVAGR